MLVWENINLYKLYIIILFCLIFFFRILLLKNVKFCISKKEIVLFVVFGLIAVHAIIFSVNLNESMHIFRGILWLILIYFIKINFGTQVSLSKIEKILGYTSYCILLTNVGALMLYGATNLSVANNFRGLFQNSNYLAALVAVICFPYFLGLISRTTGYWQRINVFFFIALSVILVILSRSRTSGLAILVTTFIYYFYFVKAKGNFTNRFMKKIIVLILGGIVVWLSFGLVANKYEGQGVFDTRHNLIQLRFTAIAQKPLVGWGFSVNEFVEYDDYNIYNSGEKGNTLLAIVEELGIVFGGFFIFYLFRLFWKSIRIFSENKETMMFALILISSAVLLQGETWLFNFNGFVGLLVWAVLFLSFGLKSFRSKNEIIIPAYR